MKFLAIVGTNLDEFFMVRGAGLVGQMRALLVEISDDGDSAARLRAAVLAARAQSMPKDNIQRAIDKASVNGNRAAQELAAIVVAERLKRERQMRRHRDLINQLLHPDTDP